MRLLAIDWENSLVPVLGKTAWSGSSGFSEKYGCVLTASIIPLQGIDSNGTHQSRDFVSLRRLPIHLLRHRLELLIDAPGTAKCINELEVEDIRRSSVPKHSRIYTI